MPVYLKPQFQNELVIYFYVQNVVTQLAIDGTHNYYQQTKYTCWKNASFIPGYWLTSFCVAHIHITIVVKN